MKAKCGAETKEKDIERLPHLWILPIKVTKSRQYCECQDGHADRKEPDIAVSCEALSNSDKYIGGCLQITIGLSMGSPMEVLKKGLEKLKVFATHRKNYNVNQLEPHSSQGLSHKPRSTYGGTHDSIHICSICWPCQVSMGG